MKFLGRHSCLVFVGAAALVACRSYDASLVRHDSRSHMVAAPPERDAATDAGDAAASDGGGGPATAPTAPPGCVLNPEFGALFGPCPLICPELCNGQDDDCDGNIDEEGNDACKAVHAVTACTRGRCLIVQCEGDYRDCDHDPSTGCEVAADDPGNCGSCGNRCAFQHALAGCVADACVPLGCAESYADCDKNPNDCETRANTLDNCESCGQQCSDDDVENAIASCASGRCGVGKCFAGYGDCNGAAADGCEQRLNTDAHCGSCDEACVFPGSVSDCSRGVCLASECEMGYDECDGNTANGCESLDTDARCGGCAKGCEPARLTNVTSAACDSQHCKLECSKGFADCDGDASNGCETSVTNLQQCGACDTPCARPNAIMTCGSGSCELVRCLPNFGDCNGNLESDGCETELLKDTECGSCDNDCTGSGKPVCSGGRCSNVSCSDPATADCDQNGLPCEVNIRTDVNHCGSCTLACEFTASSPHASAGFLCNNGRCTPSCDAGFADCDGDYRDGCETSLKTLVDCGSCGKGCAIANTQAATCDSGSCRVGKCADDWADCDADGKSCETQLGTALNCTGCGMGCMTAHVAAASCGGSANKHACQIAKCESSFLDCDGKPATGCETDITSPQNCGACRNDCTKDPNVASASCNNGSCDYSCAPNYGNCDRGASNALPGCETSLRTNSDCGSCRTECAPPNGTGDCSGGSCTLAGCDDGYKECSRAQGVCTSIKTNIDCGDCDAPCQIANGKGDCGSGACVVNSCNSGFENCDQDPATGCERNTAPPASGGQGPCLPDTGCSHGRYNGQDYYFCPMTRGYDDARTHCQSQLLGELAHINDAAENDFVRSLITANAWLGGNDRTTEGTFRWGNDNSVFFMGGSATAYTNWSSGEPNDSGGNEDCVEMYPSGLWNDQSCSSTQAFVCEVQKDLCPNDPNKASPGQCGCGKLETDSDNDGTADCNDMCPNNAGKTAPGMCGCSVADTDSDNDGTPDCNDMCPNNAGKTAPGACGCSVADTDSDNDGTPDCNDKCPADPTKIATPCGLDYTPTNFKDTVNYGLGPSTTLNCGTTTIDTTGSVTITNWCGSAPLPVIQTQTNGPELAVLPLQALTIAAGAVVRVIGSRPLVLAVRGNVTISGTIDARGNGATPGAGGNVSCSNGNGGNGSSDSNDGAGGGGGGAFGSGNPGNGGSGNAGLGSNSGGNRANSEGGSSLSPLRAGCRGGRGGNGSGSGGAGGGGGGAIQITAGGTLTVNSGGVISASGGGGVASGSKRDGGGGGGSGGAILLEAHVVSVTSGAWVTANGGGGASGHPNTDSNSAAGADGSTSDKTHAPGGAGNDAAGDGGRGAVGGQNADGGGDGGCFNGGAFCINATTGAGGGGGGGSVGRIRMHGTQSCSLGNGNFSPSVGATNCP